MDTTADRIFIDDISFEFEFRPSDAILHGKASASIELKDWDRAGDLPSSLALFGWCVSHACTAQAIEFYLNGTLLATAPLRIARPDVVAALDHPDTPLDCGFHLRISKLLIPSGAALEAVMCVGPGLAGPGAPAPAEFARIPLGTIAGLPPARIELNYVEASQPLMLLGLGRSGTTYAMRLLSGHPDILVPGAHPFEMRQPVWLWHAAQVMAAPGADASMHPDGFESRHADRLGFNPYRSRDWEGLSSAVAGWQEEVLPGAAIDFCKRQVDEFAQRCAGGTRPPRYIAQKMLVSPTHYFVRNIYAGAREVFLLRDFRDVWLSARSFNRRRDGASFGRDGFPDDLSWLRGLAYSTRQLRLAHASAGASAVTLRYEDLMRRPAAVLARLLQDLDVDSSPDQVDDLVEAAARDDDDTRAHQTAGGMAGRWRTEMTQEEKAAAAEAFGDDLTYFGYDV